MKKLFYRSLCLATCFGTLYTPPLQAQMAPSYDYVPDIDVPFHPVSTRNLEAQTYFNKGLISIYAFNHDEAYRYFEKASQLDPDLAMAYWGMALALGQNINRDITKSNHKRAYELIQIALKLAPNATENEQDYIKALSTRYSNNPNTDLFNLRIQYKTAMEKVWRKYVEDLDAATLYAESIMDIHPWHYWKADGTPEEGVLEIIAILESVLKRNPMHLGANHYYIHAVEESKNPQRALMSAQRLETLLPESGHILHMPSHIYILVGDYEKAALSNERAVAADLQYIKTYGLDGFYPLHYLSHNLFFLTRAYMWSEQYENARRAANDLYKFYAPHSEEMPELAYYALAPQQVLLYFHKWKEILELPEVPKIKSIEAFWHFSRAYASVFLHDLATAQKEKALFLKAKEQIPPSDVLGYNRAEKVLQIAEYLLEAQLAKAREQSKAYFDYLSKAIEVQDQLSYNEPPDWFYPVRQTLGATLLEVKQFQEAEKVFRRALETLPRNGRSLFGLCRSLQNQNKSADAFWVEREMKSVLKYADHSLRLDDF